MVVPPLGGERGKRGSGGVGELTGGSNIGRGDKGIH